MSIAATPRPPEPRPTEPPMSARVEAAVSVEMSRLGIPGITVAVVTDGQLQWVNGYGLADVENNVPAKAGTVYRIASLSKPITAVAAMQLAEAGKLDLDASVQKYMPGFPEPWAAITSRQILCHQSGIRHVQDEEWASTRHYFSLASSLEAFREDPLLFPPGTKAEYSTLGFNLLGCVIEKVTEKPFLDTLRDQVFAPAGMETARADDVFEVIPNRADGYRRLATGELAHSVLADTSNKIPGGGLCATAPDIARFAVALLGGGLMKRESWDAMITPQRVREGRVTGYGLGWRVGTYKGRREVWHHGGQPQVSGLLYMQPEKKLAIVFLANLENVYLPLTELARQLSLQLAR
jgi:CubicO group peptidase (beta-lactamase class C family)